MWDLQQISSFFFFLNYIFYFHNSWYKKSNQNKIQDLLLQGSLILFLLNKHKITYQNIIFMKCCVN